VQHRHDRPARCERIKERRSQSSAAQVERVSADLQSSGGLAELSRREGYLETETAARGKRDGKEREIHQLIPRAGNRDARDRSAGVSRVAYLNRRQAGLRYLSVRKSNRLTGKRRTDNRALLDLIGVRSPLPGSSEREPQGRPVS